MKRPHQHRLEYRVGGKPPPRRWSLSFSLIGGGVAWLLHLLLSYAIGEFGCTAGWGDWIVAGLSMVAWLLIAATFLTAGLAGGAIWASLRSDRASAEDGELRASPRRENQAFLARLSLILNAVFLFIIIAQAVPIFFYLRSC